MDFEELGITSCFIKRLKERNINKATDIQTKIIPQLLDKKSVLFSSATGTGKTFAYLLPILTKLLEQPFREASGRKSGASPRFVIIAPTLELCTQIESELNFLTFNLNEENPQALPFKTALSSLLIIGSVSLDRQIETLRKTTPDIIIGNQGRLLTLAKMGKLDFSAVNFIVMDEADRLVSGEMLDETSELCKIIFRASGANTFAACSATMNKKNREKILTDCLGVNKKSFNDIQFIDSKDSEVLFDRIEHWAIFSEKRRKDQMLRSLLSALNANASGKGKKSRVKALIFTSRGDEALFVLSRLQHHHVSAAGLFGKVSKKPISGAARREALDSFRDGNVMALVSTDLAARGLDIPGITHVISLDVPADSEVYIHRCGRTGRAGNRGVMVTIGDETQMRLLAALEKKLKIKVYPKELHYGKICAPAPIED